jgi:hypothetical protein
MHAMQALSQLSYGPTCTKLQHFATQVIEVAALNSNLPQRPSVSLRCPMLHSLGPSWDRPRAWVRIERRAWLNFGIEIKQSAYRKAAGMIPKPRAVGSLRMRLPD